MLLKKSQKNARFNKRIAIIRRKSGKFEANLT